MANASSIIGDPKATKAALISAIRQLGPTDEPATFWAAIANSAAYSRDHRRRAVFQLLRRHLPPGANLGELARLLEGPEWLDEDDITVVGGLAGKIPVSWAPGDTVVVVSVLPHASQPNWAVYLRVAGNVDASTVGVLLRTGTAAPEIKQKEILEVGFSPGANSSAGD